MEEDPLPQAYSKGNKNTDSYFQVNVHTQKHSYAYCIFCLHIVLSVTHWTVK